MGACRVVYPAINLLIIHASANVNPEKKMIDKNPPTKINTTSIILIKNTKKLIRGSGKLISSKYSSAPIKISNSSMICLLNDITTSLFFVN